MADFTPDEGEEKMNGVLTGKVAFPTNLRVVLFQNTPANINTLGEDIVYADLTLSTGFVGGDSKTLTPASWTIPTGASAGQPATYPQLEFEADTGGADDVAGYALVDSDDVIWGLGLNPQVESSGTPVTMLEGAKYRVNPQLGTA